MAGTLKYGSQGDDVKDLQNRLNASGYQLSVDGKFGNQTLSAVKDYQQQNGLSVDGIVGVNTWGKLLGNQEPGTSETTQELTVPNYDNSTWGESTKGSAASGAYQAAKNALAQHGDFVFSENEWLNSLKNDIENYDDFSYDINSDALYQQYAEQYMRQGKLASADVMGQAAAMTGGYGNSYAATVGNQAYQSYLQQLNDRVPELYQLALDRHNMGKQDLYDQYGMLLSEYEREYGLYSEEYNKLLDALGIAENDYYKGADMFYTEQGNKNSVLGQEFTDAMALKNYDLNNRQVALQEKQYEDSLKKYTTGGSVSSSGGGSGNGGGTGGGNTSGVTDAMRNKAASFESNDDLANYIDGLIASGAITEAQGDTLYAEYVDGNEKYSKDTGAISYKDMIGSSKGWTVVDKGGWNFVGIDGDAKIKAPNGETIRLDQLRDKLKAEGMTHNEATDAIKKLQQNLGISSNWFFGA